MLHEITLEEQIVKMNYDCVPCFVKQALGAARLAGADRGQLKEVLSRLGGMIPGFSFDVSPPQLSRDMYRMVMEVTENDDPFRAIKEKSNRIALSRYEMIRQKVFSSADPLRTAVDLSIAGNIIDFGVRKSFDIDRELTNLMREGSSVSHLDSKPIYFYPEFRDALQRAETLLVLGDNAGEVVLDRILLEVITDLYPRMRVTYAVKERPVINDALVEDALLAGLDKVAEVISSGSDAPGTILSMCTPAFVRLFRDSDMVISKGQGNFETLTQEDRCPVFFLFMAKCAVVAKYLECELGDVILLDYASWEKGS